MKKCLIFPLLAASIGLQAQTTNDADRLRISTDRSRLEAAFALEETACYKRFWVNNCLDDVKVRRRDALDDLRRQEIVLNDEERKAKAAAELQRIEDKSTPEKLQQEADQRAQAVKDFDDRMARDKQKSADRELLKAGEKANLEAAAGRIKDNQAKAAARSAKQSAEADERLKYNEHVKQANERQERYAREKASRTNEPSKPLPMPK
jgi:colicin import membrane protein